MDRLRLLLAALALASVTACDDPQKGWKVADREFRGFQDVYPVLMRDCGFHTCHGAEDRAFRIYGPGRGRLTDDVRALDALTGDEIALSFSIALSMIDADHPERSLLLKKPLALEAGGAAHGGIDDFGRNVYRTKDDEGYKAIEKWVLAEPESVAEPEPEPETVTCEDLEACCRSLSDELDMGCMLAVQTARAMGGDSSCASYVETFCPSDADEE